MSVAETGAPLLQGAKPLSRPIPPEPARAPKAELKRPLAGPLGLLGLTVVLIIGHQGRLLELIYPVASFLVAFNLYRRSPAHHLGFVFWLFFLTPEVRRFADFLNGSFNSVSPIMVSPLLAVALCGLGVVTNFRALGQRRAAPLVLIMLAMFYSYVIGLVQVGPAAASVTLANWLFPALVGFRLVVTWQEYPAYRRVLLKTFVWGSFVMGVYGVIQFVSPPPWDAFWLLSSGMTSEGSPVPFGMRVCSTMNSFGAFSITIMATMLMTFAASGRWPMIAGLLALLALMFTSARSAWGGAMVGFIYAVAMLDARRRLRLIGGLLVFAMMCAPVVMVDQVSDRLMSRLDTFQDLSKDNSYRVRAEFYSTFWSRALSDIQGQGLGMTGLGTKLSDDNSLQLSVVFDSGLMEVPFVMGWPGTLLYVTGVVTLLWRGLTASRKLSKDRFSISGVGVALSFLSLMYFANTMVSLAGTFFYIGILMPVIRLRYVREIGEPELSRSQGQQQGQPGLLVKEPV